ncbi:hypothetical protein F5Y16DRAFT_249520 [Xylariaceae sp. FL0255]|nr:hypothetical protein F5Y16DRAFT_249520 [Xylariaceae sp. FL0255]
MTVADKLSAPGSSSYSSDTLNVGDGTWDFTKNDFLLPNLMPLNLATTQYNGMGNRFSTLTQYHTLITGHGVLAAITFLFIIPISVMYARFHQNREITEARRIHAYMNVVALGLSTVVFILGFFAVGPSRALSNPHHGIGVAIYVMILVQAISGRLVKNIYKRSLRLMLHRWIGRATALLGIAQVPLGLALYGSPKFTFVLYALWMSFLLLLYFILSWRHEPEHLIGSRSEAGVTESGYKSGRTGRSGFGWAGPLAAGVGTLALLRGRKNRRERSRSRSRSRSHGRVPEVIPSRRGSASYMNDEKYSERTDHRGGGIMNKLLAVGGVLGAGALVKKIADRRENRRYNDEEYSAVATDTPSRFGPNRTRPQRKRQDSYTESDITEDRTQLGPRRPRSPILPGPGNPVATAAALSAAHPPRPSTPPRAAHGRPAQSSRLESEDYSDYTSYISPSRRTHDEHHGGGAGKGLLAGLGLGWFAKKLKDRRGRNDQDERIRVEEERRDGRHGPRYTGDGYGTPTRSSRRRPPAVAPTATTMTEMTENTESSLVEDRPAGTGVGGPPMPPLGASHAQTGPPPTAGVIRVPAGPSRSRSRSTHTQNVEPASMPPMPDDPHGIFHPLRPESGSESYLSAGGGTHKRHSSRHGRGGATAAAATAGVAELAADEGSSRRRDRSRSQAPSQPVSVKVKYHDDRDRNVTLRRLTDEEARREQRNRRSNSVSSLSGNETPTRRRYRRDSSSARKTADEAEAERLANEPLSPPAPAFAGGRRAGKDSAYYSGQPGPSGGGTPLAAPTISSIDSPDSHGTWSALSPSPSGPIAERPAGSAAASAAERRRRRRLERNARPQGGGVEFN